MGFVAFNLDVLEGEIKQAFNIRIKRQCRERFGLSVQLLADLLEMIRINMRVAKGMDEIARL